MTSLVDLAIVESRAAALLEAAKKAGAEQADVIAARGLSQGIEIRNGALEEMDSSESDRMALRVFCGHRTAIVSTSETGDTDFSTLAERAVATAKAAPEDPYASLAAAGETGQTAVDLELVDPDFPTMDSLMDRAQAAEAAALDVAGISKSGGASAGFSLAGVVLATSNGFHGQYMRSNHSLWATAIAGEGTGMERDYDFVRALHLADLDAPETIGRNAAERAVKRQAPSKVETRTGTVVFEPRLASGLVSTVAQALNGASVARGTSFLKDRMGEQIFKAGIRITDDPLRVRGLGSRPFDGEGVAANPLTLVENGCISSWVLDLASAAELGLKTTGHAGRGIGGPPSPSSTNLTLLPGDETPEALIAGIDFGIYVTELIGRGGNTTTGDYSRGASGFLIEKGELKGPVAEITVAGNLDDMFAQLTPANDLRYRMTTNAPTVAVDGLTIAGR
ncbi:MAG: TldD/PmbA family protein [Pseudomonadota bacterium]